MRHRLTLLVALVIGALFVPGASGLADGTPPLITFELTGTPGANGWYVSPTTIRWRVEDPESGITASSGCDTTTLTADTTGVKLTCSATNGIDVSTSVSLTVKIDRTPPSVTAISADRPPDSGEWYTRPVTYSVAGADATSGVAGCESPTYAGPDSGSAEVAATCSDRAGHVSPPARSSLRYDATAPVLRGVSAQASEGSVTVRWQPLPASEWVEVVRVSAGNEKARPTLYRGGGARFVDRRVRNGVRYRYEVIGRDEAGHATQVNVAATPFGPLRSPAPASRVRRPPTLRWKAVRGAALYNVQLFRRGRKVLSAWPRSPHLRLSRRWRYDRRSQQLVPGRYRWFVWPAYRERGRLRFGKLLGRSTFVVVR